MIESFKELSQVLATIGISISTSQEEYLLIVVKNLSTSLELNKESKPHEPHSPDDLQGSTDHLRQTTAEAENSCTISEGEGSLAPENEEFTTCLSATTLYTHETTDSKEDSLYGMAKEDV